MSLFDENIVEKKLIIRNIYDVNVTNFYPGVFYKWIWNEAGIDYPPLDPRYGMNGYSEEDLMKVLINKLGEIPAEDFIKWKNFLNLKFPKVCDWCDLIKFFRKFFKKIVKRKYLSTLNVILSGDDIIVSVCDNSGFSWERCDTVIVFSEKYNECI